jgi:hypothetical protein
MLNLNHPVRGGNQLTAGCVRALEQGLALIERLDDALYSGTGALPVQSGVGAHFRHCIDFFEGFLAGIASGRIDYDRRERDPLGARDRAFAATKLRIVISELRSLPVTHGHAGVLVSLEGDADYSPGSTRWCRSTVSREIQFLLSHTVHHYALIALALRLRGFEPGEEFGVAPSTLKHWRSKASVREDGNVPEESGARGDADAREDGDARGNPGVREEEAACAL